MSRALSELDIYAEEGLSGAIINDLYGDVADIDNVFRAASGFNKLTLGVNVRNYPYMGLAFAERYGAKFVQFDSVQEPAISIGHYDKWRKDFSNVCVLGGVRFKYQEPSGKSLEEDIAEGMAKCDAIVTAGHGRGIETPISKTSFNLVL